MDALMGGVIVGAIAGVVGGLLAGVAILAFALLKKPTPCPECGTPAPKFRQPANSRQFWWGGWTCAECGCEFDGRGRKVEA